MSGHGLPSRPVDSGSPTRSPEQEGYPSRNFPPPHRLSGEVPPHFDQPYRGGYEGSSDRHYEGRREDDRWDEDYSKSTSLMDWPDNETASVVALLPHHIPISALGIAPHLRRHGTATSPRTQIPPASTIC